MRTKRLTPIGAVRRVRSAIQTYEDELNLLSKTEETAYDTQAQLEIARKCILEIDTATVRLNQEWKHLSVQPKHITSYVVYNLLAYISMRSKYLINKLFNKSVGCDASKLIDSIINDVQIKSYFDSYGELKFCTLSNVLIDHTTDYRLIEIKKSVNNKTVELLSNYKGSLNSLYQRVVK